MQPNQAHELPNDIILLISKCSSFEALASLVRCNRSLHAICTPLLFGEIRLHKPTQLIKLYNNRKALAMLSGTKSLFIEEGLFGIDNWAGLVERSKEASNYLIIVLRAATSLLRLQIFDPPAPIYIWTHIETELCSLSSDPTFLPKLEVLVGTKAVPLVPLHDNRPIKFLCSYEQFDETIMEVYPSLVTCPALLESAQNLSASEIGTLIRGSKGSLLVKYPYFKFTVRFPEEIRAKERPSIPDLLVWLQEVILEAKISSDGIKRLYINFDPSPSPYQSTSMQHTVVTGINELLPHLEHVQIAPLVTWEKYPSSLESPQEPIPAWTPGPDRFTIDWWLDTLHLSLTDTTTQEEAEHIAGQLREGMSRRYAPAKVLSMKYLVDYLLNRGAAGGGVA